MSRQGILKRFLITALTLLIVLIASFYLLLEAKAWHFQSLPASLLHWVLPDQTHAKFKDIAIGLQKGQWVVEIDDLVLTQTKTDQTNPTFEVSVPKIQANLPILSVFSRSLFRFNQLSVDQAKVFIYQNKDGTWGDFSSSKNALDWQDWLTTLPAKDLNIKRAQVILKGLNSQQQWSLNSQPSANDLGWLLSVHKDMSSQEALTISPSLIENAVHYTLKADLGAISELSNFLTASPFRWQSQGIVELILKPSTTFLNETITAKISASELKLQRNPASPSLLLDQFQLSGQLNKQNHLWQGEIDFLKLVYQHRALALPKKIRMSQKKNQWKFEFEPFELNALQPFFVLLPGSADVHAILANIKPRGQLQQGVLTYKNDSQLEMAQRFRFQAKGINLAISAFDEVPAIGPLTGKVDTGLLEGEAQLINAEPTEFSLPKVFQKPWLLDHLAGKLRWKIESDRQQLWIDNLSFERDSGKGKGSLYLDLPDYDVDQLKLNFILESLQLSPENAWLPENKLPKKLSEWLSKNIQKGEIPNGNIDLHLQYGHSTPKGEIEQEVKFDDPKYPSSFKANLTLKGGQIGYIPGWPVAKNIDAILELKNDQLSADISQAQVANLELTQANLSIVEEQLQFATQLQGSAKSIKQLLKEAATHEPRFQEQLSQWDIGDGEAKGKITATVPLSNVDKSWVNVQGELSNVQASLKAANLQFNQTNAKADLRWSGDNHFQLTGDWSSQLLGHLTNGKFSFTDQKGEMNFQGDFSAGAILRWLKLPSDFSMIRGQSHFKGQLKINADQNPILQIRTDLTGIDLAIPEPFGKKSSEKTPFTLSYNFAHKTGEIVWADRIKSQWQTINRRDQGVIWLQQWPNDFHIEASQPSWVLNWPKVDLDWDAWKAWAQYWFAQQSTLKLLNQFTVNQASQLEKSATQLSLHIGCWLLNHECLAPIDANLQKTDQKIALDINSDWLQAQLDYDSDHERPLQIHIKHLKLDPFWTRPVENTVDHDFYDQVLLLTPANKTLAQWPSFLSRWPAGEVLIDQLSLRQQDAKLAFNWRFESDKFSLEIPYFDLLKSHLSGDLIWQKVGEKNFTLGDVQVQLADVAPILKLFDQPDVLTNKNGMLSLHFSWPGAPWQGAWKTATGKINLTLKEGQFTSINSPSARLIGLFNFDNLIRRLQLNFSDLTDKGLSFKTVSGQSILHEGLLTTQGPVVIDAVSTHFKLTGQVDLINRTINQHLAITLPFSQSLPIAALIVGAPEVGVFLLAAHWMFGSFLDRFTEVHYHLRGPWTSPEFKIESTN